MSKVVLVINIIVSHSTGWCKSEKLKKIDVVQWEMLLLILKWALTLEQNRLLLYHQAVKQIYHLWDPVQMNLFSS